MKRNDLYRILVDSKHHVYTGEEEETKEQASPSDTENYFSDEYFFNMTLQEWCKIKPQGLTYTPRTGHECLFYKDCIYLFGGTDDDDRKNDLYMYDIY